MLFDPSSYAGNITTEHQNSISVVKIKQTEQRKEPLPVKYQLIQHLEVTSSTIKDEGLIPPTI
jgi:hypothetical protein